MTLTVHAQHGGDAFVVEGTKDVEAARRAVFQHLLDQGLHTPGEAADRIYRLQPDIDPCPDAPPEVWLQ